MRLEGEQNQRDVAFAELKAQLEDEQRQRESNLAARRLDNENTAGARTFVGALSSEKSPIAWVAPTLSLLVVVGFFSILVMFVALKQYLEAAPAPSIPIGLDAKALTPEQIRAFGTDRSRFRRPDYQHLRRRTRRCLRHGHELLAWVFSGFPGQG